MRKGLQFRYGMTTASLIIGVAVTLGGFFLFQYKDGFKDFNQDSLARTEQLLLDDITQRGVSVSAILVENLKNHLYKLDMQEMLLLLVAVKESPDAIKAVVYDNNGRVVHDGVEEIPSYGNQLAAERVLPNRIPEGETVTKISGNRLAVWRSIWLGDQPIGGVMIEFSLESILADLQQLKAEQDDQYAQSLEGIIFLVLAATSVLVLIGVLLSMISSRRIVKPIQDVARSASSIGSHRQTKELTYSRQDELGELVESFNDMNARLQQEVVEREKTEAKLRQMALYDALTNLPNRTLIFDRLRIMIDNAKRNSSKLAVMFVDLDDFKKVNDTLGHDVGDVLLIESAKRFSSVTRPSDSVGRLGGDEFILLVDGLSDVVEASPVAEKILDLFKVPFTVDGRDLTITASIGIAVYPEDGESENELLQKADSAMYHSKELGRNAYSYFTSEMNASVARRFAIEEQMHAALDKGEFAVFYQPKVRLSDSAVVGAEALLRWENGTLGRVMPDEFIAISEQTGFINRLGDFVLQRAISDINRINQNNQRQLNVAINVSPRQFRQSDLTEEIKGYLQAGNIRTGGLELEITEGVLMSGQLNVQKTLTLLREAGVKIAMDDFGTGYSSLSYLREYSFDVLKIDQSFIRDIDDDPEDRSLIEAMIVMAHSLGLEVVAEGVETATQVAFLKQQGCDYAQGYYFGRPVMLSEFEAMLASGERECVPV
ncbi:MAG: EAL domain-containing protein [Motiliproteus sp.]|nr:EAL domain-containing protein [Motiliproteus sp.]MCW9053977.1 EAL domain-containing protein [Motiliproteus sp.]